MGPKPTLTDLTTVNNFCVPFQTLEAFLFTTQSFYSHYSGTKEKKKNENTRNYRQRNDRNYITICTIFESVCNSQTSKAFERINIDKTNLQRKKCHENGLEILY